jgi:hypothetical protein
MSFGLRGFGRKTENFDGEREKLGIAQNPKFKGELMLILSRKAVKQNTLRKCSGLSSLRESVPICWGRSDSPYVFRLLQFYAELRKVREYHGCGCRLAG